MDAKKRYRNKTKGSGRLTLGMGLLAALLAFAPGAWAGTLQVNGSTGVVNVLEGGTANVSWDFSENAPATGVLLRVNNAPMGPCTSTPPYPDFSNPDAGYSAGTIGSKDLTLTNPSYVPGNTYYIKVCAWEDGGSPENLGPESNTVLLNYGKFTFPINLEALCHILGCSKPTIDPAKFKEIGLVLGLGGLKTKRLKWNEHGPTTLQCGSGISWNSCNGFALGNSNLPPGYPTSCNDIDNIAGSFAIEGIHHHYGGGPAAAFAGVGTDKYEISLKNGWKIKSADLKISKTSNGDVVDGPPLSTATGKTTWEVWVDWVVGPGHYVAYCYNVVIEGPKGVPHY